MRYIIYARKSTEDEDRQILSIEAQLYELREFARQTPVATPTQGRDVTGHRKNLSCLRQIRGSTELTIEVLGRKIVTRLAEAPAKQVGAAALP